jgi:hypothetical protein
MRLNRIRSGPQWSIEHPDDEVWRPLHFMRRGGHQAAALQAKAGHALMHGGRFNRVGIDRLAALAGAFQVYFRVEEGDPLEFG